VWGDAIPGVSKEGGQCSLSNGSYSEESVSASEQGDGNLSKGVKSGQSQVNSKMPISMHLERRPSVQILKMWFLRKQLVSCDCLVGCSALLEVVGEALKSSIPNLFSQSIELSYFPPSCKG